MRFADKTPNNISRSLFRKSISNVTRILRGRPGEEKRSKIDEKKKLSHFGERYVGFTLPERRKFDRKLIFKMYKARALVLFGKGKKGGRLLFVAQK